jgi:hypothetical protein
MEWAAASRLKETSAGYDTVIRDNNIKVYNAGDTDCHFTQILKFKDGKIPKGSIYIESSEKLSWSEMAAQGEDAYVKINSKLNLIEGYTESDLKSGHVYNQYITEGTFFKLPQGESTIGFDLSGEN